MGKKTVSGLLLTLLLIGMLTLAFKIELVSAIVPSYPAIYVDPPIVENIMPSNNVTVSIKTDYTGLICAYQFTLSFNASILHGINVTNGDIITIEKSPDAQFIPGTFYNTEGTLSLTLAFIFIFVGPIPSVWGPGTLADVTFMVVGYGTSNITLGPETQLWGWPPYPWEEPPIIIDAFSMPDHIGHGFFSNEQDMVASTIDIDPDTLHLHSKGQWITAYIQLPEGYNAEDVDATTILLNETIQPVLDPKYDFATNSSEYIVDHDDDGILERMVKFNRTEVASWIHDDLGIVYGDVVIEITGELGDGTPFEGTDTIKVLFPGDLDDDGDVDLYDFDLFSDAYGTSANDIAYNWVADLNEDLIIGMYDLGTFSDYYGKTAV